MENFEKLSLFKRMRMIIEELEIYYLELRKYEYDKGSSLKGIELRKKIHGILLELIKLERKLSGETLTVISDERSNTKRPIIYACTHIGGNDVQRAFEAIKEHAYLFIGDLKGLYKDLTGLILYLNGAIMLQNDDLNGKLTEAQIKEDKRIAKARAIELLNRVGDLLIYPEGAWNITPDLPVMDIFNGTIDIASKTNAIIIPMAIEQYGKDFVANIGDNIDFASKTHMCSQEMKEYLRDSMATLKYEIFQSVEPVKRTNVSITKEQFAEDIVSRCPYNFTIEDVEKTRYHDRTKVPYDEVFAFQKNLIPNKQNAFLFKK